MEATVPLSLGQLAIKAKSKRELYLLLANDCGVYMPPMQDSNAGYVRGVVTGSTKFVRLKDLKVIQVPFLKTLSTQEIYDFCRKNIKIQEYLPLYRKFRLPNRTWICNIAYTLLGEKFKKWVASKMSDREQYIINKKCFTVNVIPEFSEAVASSKSVSVLHGRSHFLLRNSGRKRKKLEESKEIEAIVNEGAVREAEMMAELDNLKERINEYKMIQIEDSKYKEIVDSLIQKGVISRTGEEIIKF